jgi:hypothetical protein
MENFEEFQKRCRAAGYSDQDTVNTWELMTAIERVLDDKDLDRYLPPEAHQPKLVRLARLFIDLGKKNTRDGDAVIASWLRTQGVEESIAVCVTEGVHWRWFHDEKRKTRDTNG